MYDEDKPGAQPSYQPLTALTDSAKMRHDLRGKELEMFIHLLRWIVQSMLGGVLRADIDGTSPHVPTLCHLLPRDGLWRCRSKKGRCGISVIEEKPTILGFCRFSERPTDDRRFDIRRLMFLLFLFHRRLFVYNHDNWREVRSHTVCHPRRSASLSVRRHLRRAARNSRLT